MTLPDNIEAMLRDMRSRIIAAPMFLKGMIAPVDTYLHGHCTWEVFRDRSTTAIACYDLAVPDIRETLDQHWYQEVDFVKRICRALCDKDFDRPADEAAFRAEVVTALQEYVAQPEPEDRVYII